MQACLELLGAGDLPQGARVVCECEAPLELPEVCGRLQLIKQRRYGDTRVGIYERTGAC